MKNIAPEAIADPPPGMFDIPPEGVRLPRTGNVVALGDVGHEGQVRRHLDVPRHRTAAQQEDCMNFKGLNVGAVIERLKRMGQEEQVTTTLESYRGYYEDAALGYGDGKYPKVKDLLAHFEATIGKVFHGWKGGNGTPISYKTALWVANPGETGDTVIVGVQQPTECGYVILLTRHEDEVR